MHNGHKGRVHSQNGFQLLRGVLFGKRRGSKVKRHFSSVNIRTGLARYPASLHDLHSTLFIMGTCPFLELTWSCQEFYFNLIEPFLHYFYTMGFLLLFGKNTILYRFSNDILQQRRKHYAEEYVSNKHACSFIITIHWPILHWYINLPVTARLYVSWGATMNLVLKYDAFLPASIWHTS